MDPLTVLNTIHIASPCPASWDDMEGDARARFCGSCQKHVYNVSAMTAVDAAALIERSEGRLCVQLYRRRDGTVLTADCPVGVRSVRLRRLRRVATGAVVGLSVLVMGALVKVRGASGAGPRCSPPPSGPGVTFEDWKDWALEAIGWLPRQGGPIAGAMRPSPTIVPPPQPTGVLRGEMSCPAPGPAGGDGSP